jgi:hypothetical protein
VRIGTHCILEIARRKYSDAGLQTLFFSVNGKNMLYTSIFVYIKFKCNGEMTFNGWAYWMFAVRPLGTPLAGLARER